MALPTTITDSSLYTVGYNARGEAEAVVWCTAFTECAECHTMHALMVVNEAQEYRCCGCAGRLR